METLRLILHETKDTKNKVVYGTQDGSVIQGVYVDRDALGDAPPDTIQVINFHEVEVPEGYKLCDFT